MLKNIFLVVYYLVALHFKKQKSKKILLVADYGKIGGTRTYFISLLHYLKKQQYEVTVLMNNQAEDAEIDNLIIALDFTTISVHFDFWCINFENLPSGLTRKQLVSYQLKEMVFWFSILNKKLFSSIVFSTAYPEQYLYIFLLPVKLCYILHTQPLVKADKFKRWILLHKLGRQKQIITVSEASKAAIENYWLNKKRNPCIKVIYNFYEPKFDNNIASNLSGHNKVLTIGSCVEYKNPSFFIQCAKQIIDTEKKNSIEFFWAGSGPLLEECRNCTKDYPQIKFVGNVENVEKLYAASTIYFQPSIEESHGIAVLGAMFHSLPCIVSDKGGLSESVINNVNGYVVDVNSIGDSVRKINYLIQNNQRAKEFGLEGKKIYSQKFTEEIWTRQMKAVL